MVRRSCGRIGDLSDRQSPEPEDDPALVKTSRGVIDGITAAASDQAEAQKKAPLSDLPAYGNAMRYGADPSNNHITRSKMGA